MVYPSVPPRSPVLALLLSILVIGVGHMYIGQVTKGVALFIVALIAGVLILPHAAMGIWIFGLLDVYIIARKLRRGLPVRQWEWL